MGLRDNWGSHYAHLLSGFPHWDDGRNVVGLVITISTLPGIQDVLNDVGEVNTRLASDLMGVCNFHSSSQSLCGKRT